MGFGLARCTAVVRAAHGGADVRLVGCGRSVPVPAVGPSVLHLRPPGADRRRTDRLRTVEAGTGRAGGAGP